MSGRNGKNTIEEAEWSKKNERRAKRGGGPQVRDQNNVRASLVPSMHARAKDPKRFEQHEAPSGELAIPVVAQTARLVTTISDRFSHSEAHREATTARRPSINPSLGAISCRRKHRSALRRVCITSETDA